MVKIAIEFEDKSSEAMACYSLPIQYQYTGLWRVLVEQSNIDAALLTAEKGRAQALTDLVKSSFDNTSPRFKTYCNTAFLEESFLKSILILQIFVTTIDICWYKI